MARIRVLVAGAAGRMGREVVRAVCAQEDMELVGAVDRVQVGKEAARVAGLDVPSVSVVSSLSDALADSKPDVAVDFTIPSVVRTNVTACLNAKVACVVGATGLTPADLDEIAALCKQNNTPAFVAPNFAIGAVLMMQLAAQAAKHFDCVEIIELHHPAKLDAPSGTALRTAKLIAEAAKPAEALATAGRAGVPEFTLSHVEGPAAGGASAHPSRGQAEGPIHIHSIRLPGLVAHQEVIFGGLGQTLTIRHDSISRESFMPGVMLAIRKVRSLSGLVVGLEGVM